MKLRLYILVALVLFGNIVKAQSLSNLRTKFFPTKSDTLFLDSLSVIPNSLTLQFKSGVTIDTSSYSLYPFGSKLIWKHKPSGDSIRASFRVYPFAFTAKTFHKNYEAFQKANEVFAVRPFLYTPDEAKGGLIDFGALDYNGNYSRGLSFGNNQDIVLNSAFNLSMSGMVAKDLEVKAVITDNNIPLQPDGNTQQLQEFDKIFIQLTKGTHTVIAGDFDQSNTPESYFLKFMKKAQGGSYRGSVDVRKHGTFRAIASGGISKGKVTKNTLAVTEGNQGPYKLTGANGETFIIVLANSEAVYINGVRLQRGADRDYIIDYNLGEIRFTPKRLITADLRITVEFEYSDRNYLRTLAFVNTEWKAKKYAVRFNVFSEQDNKNQNLQQDLTTDKRNFLAGLGDSIQNAFYRQYDSIAFDPNRIMYWRRDTLYDLAHNLHDSVFVYSTDSTHARFAPSFALVGDKKGNYIAATSIANGRVYQWIAPVLDPLSGTLVKQGNYEAVTVLVAPQMSQLYTVGGDYLIDKNNKISTEVALSNNNKNLLSAKDKQNDLGTAARVGYNGTIPIKRDSAGNTQSVVLEANYEFVQNTFRPIERYRSVEFNRDFNLGNPTVSHTEHMGNFAATYNWSKYGFLTYRLRSFIQDTLYKGFENSISGNIHKNNVSLLFTISHLASFSKNLQTNFLRPKIDLSYKIQKLKGWKVGTAIDNEINLIKDAKADTLLASSYLFQNYKAYFHSPDSSKNKYGVDITFRFEHHPLAASFDKPHLLAQTVNVYGFVLTLKNQTLNWNVTYRHVKEHDSTAANNQLEHYYLGRIEYNLNLWKGLLRSTSLYELGAGREQKTQISYQRSLTNQGDYEWVDDNHDGIKQLNEFHLVQPGLAKDSSFVKVYIVTPEYIAVNTTQFSQSLNLNPASIIKAQRGFLKVLSMFSAFSNVQINKKVFADKNNRIGLYFNPFPLNKDQASLVSLLLSSRNSIIFNKLNPKYGAQIDLNYSKNQNLLTSGIETRTTQSEGVTARWNIWRQLSITDGYVYGIKANLSDFYANQQYRFYYHETHPELSLQLKSKMRIATGYVYSFKKNIFTTNAGQVSINHSTYVEGRFNLLNKANFNAKFTYAAINYKDNNETNQQLEYAMLEGLKNGNNFVWNLTVDYKLSTVILITLTYDGRKSDANRTIHTGRAELRALF